MKHARIEKIDGINKIIGYIDPLAHIEHSKELEANPSDFIGMTDEQHQQSHSNQHNRIEDDGNTSHHDFRTDEQIKSDELNALKSQINQATVFTFKGHYFSTDEEAHEGQTHFHPTKTDGLIVKFSKTEIPQYETKRKEAQKKHIANIRKQIYDKQ